MKNEHCTAILGDWDGTFHRTLQPWCDATIAQLESRQIHVSPRQVAMQIVPSLTQAEKFGVQDIDTFISAVVTQAMLSLPFAELELQLWQTLSQAKQSGLKIAVVSNSSLMSIQQAIDEQKPDSLFFSHIVTPEQHGGLRKPNKELLLVAMALLGAIPAETKMLGDSATDLQAAKNAGVESILWYPEHNEAYYDFAELKALNPTYVARTGTELAEILSLGD